ncbi:MAG TPA: hypothetical protein VK097_10145 [Lentibacillus sp.]|uniref:hypothetical protein n=1 Tax=Lentibacillus sp. TaxID=1925746 RepID=UPI002B4B3184|nr:hypothetical protein [Lentibacillus sp.]HLR62788.1 hypothetical protein [Lentibacillus sp.]
MRKINKKMLIVLGNVIGVIAIISIILLHNYNTQSITIDDSEAKLEDPEEDGNKSEPSIEFRNINHSETIAPVGEYTANDTEAVEEEVEDVTQEDETVAEEVEPETSIVETEVNDTEKNNVDTAETTEVAADEDTSESNTWERTTSDNTSNNSNSAGSSSQSGKSALKEKKDKPMPDEKGDSRKKEETKSEPEAKPKPLTYTEKVQNRLSGYTVTGENPVTISNKNGRVASIVDGQVIIRTKDPDLAKQIVNKLSGLAAP